MLLRKHIALNLTDGEVDDLSKFMEHEKPNHLKIYRQPVGTKEILNVSQWLEKPQGSYKKMMKATLCMKMIAVVMMNIRQYTETNQDHTGE